MTFIHNFTVNVTSFLRSGMSVTINPLASPKGQKKLCELCQKPAHLQCSKCRVAFYCDVAHQQADWNSIHHRVCELLIPIRAPTPFYSLQADRDHHQAQAQKRLEQLLELSYAAAQGQVLEGKYEEALPAAQLSLRCALDLYSSDAVKLVPAYLLLAEANVGLGSLTKAEGFLSQAEWAVMKTPGCSRMVLHKLHRSLGRLYTALGNYHSALLHFANDVYYASEELGLNSVETARGYFLMANVFLKQEKLEIANSLYSQVASTWHGHLTKLLESYKHKGTWREIDFDEAKRAEVHQMLTVMLEAQKQHAEMHRTFSHAQSTLLCHSLAMLWFLCNDHNEALDFAKKALEFSLQCEQNNLSECIQSLINEAEKHCSTQQTCETSH
ncbi:zinc finger MYND domain-containing protein 12 isoform X2 [Hoplias malabaricus]|uniref:zinc finger MYND domain-containing protein 12 isoform X2 n=1 Tax=Hoplias malabaricus TaxID=27720 RepID=UPI0034619C74